MLFFSLSFLVCLSQISLSLSKRDRSVTDFLILFNKFVYWSSSTSSSSSSRDNRGVKTHFKCFFFCFAIGSGWYEEMDEWRWIVGY